MTRQRDRPVEHDPNVLPEIFQPPRTPVDPSLEVDTQRNTPPKFLAGTDEKESYVPATPTDNGKSRRSFWIKIAVVTLVLIVILVGGIIGGLLSRKRSSPGPPHSSSGTGDTTSSPIPTSSNAPNPGNNTNIAVPAPDPIRKIVTARNAGPFGILLNAWQKTNSDLWMRVYYRAQPGKGQQKWGDAFQLRTNLVAINNTPIAVATWKSKDSFEVRIHYTAQGQDTIAALALQCYGNNTCTDPESQSIAGSQVQSASSGFTMLSPTEAVLRQYTVNSDGLIAEAKYDSNTWDEPKPISNKAKAHKASPIAAGLINTEIWVFWFNELKELQLASSNWKTGTWSQIENIVIPIPSQLPRALGLAISTTSSLDLQLFFLDGTKVQQIRFSSGRWTTSEGASSIPEASIPNGPIGVTGLNESSVRLYYPINGNRAMKEIIYDEKKAWRPGAWEEGYD